jgi:hypothetical protein
LCSGKTPDLFSGGARFESWRDISYPDWDFVLASSVSPGEWLVSTSIHYGRFFPNPFQYIIQLSIYHSILYDLASDSIIKQTARSLNVPHTLPQSL